MPTMLEPREKCVATMPIMREVVCGPQAMMPAKRDLAAAAAS